MIDIVPVVRTREKLDFSVFVDCIFKSKKKSRLRLNFIRKPFINSYSNEPPRNRGLTYGGGVPASHGKLKIHKGSLVVEGVLGWTGDVAQKNSVTKRALVA